MKKLLLLASCLISFVYAQLPSERKTDWTNTGYQGSGDSGLTIIDITTFGAIGDSITDNSNAFSIAISTIPSPAVLYFPPGVYLFSSSINLPSEFILKGAGADSTHLKFNLNGAISNCINMSGSLTGDSANVTDGFYRNSNWIVVDNSTAFNVNDYLDIFQQNGSWDTNPVSWADNSIGQILRISNISGDTLFLEKPLRINYAASFNPKVRKFIPSTNAGISCLKVSREDNVTSGVCFNIYLNYAVNCFIKAIESSMSIGSHIEMDYCSNISITESYIHNSYAYDGSGTRGYGITLFAHTGQCLIENNIMRVLRHSFSLQTGANGNVIAYNYSREPNRSEIPNDYGADISFHGHYPYANLIEGNIVQNVMIDQTWGPNGPYNTFLRNRAELYGFIVTAGSVQNDTMNIIGNEITNTGLFLGNYLINGNGHFQFGNNVRGTATPSNTTNVTDTSYYRTTPPNYWNNIPYPSIGYPNNLSAGTIPAKVRFTNNDFTPCVIQNTTSLSNNESDNIQLFPNPFSESFIVKAIDLQSVTVMNLEGRIVSETNLSNENIFRINLSQVPGNFFIVKIKTKGDVAIKRLVKIN